MEDISLDPSAGYTNTRLMYVLLPGNQVVSVKRVTKQLREHEKYLKGAINPKFLLPPRDIRFFDVHDRESRPIELDGIASDLDLMQQLIEHYRTQLPRASCGWWNTSMFNRKSQHRGPAGFSQYLVLCDIRTGKEIPPNVDAAFDGAIAYTVLFRDWGPPVTRVFVLQDVLLLQRTQSWPTTDSVVAGSAFLWILRANGTIERTVTRQRHVDASVMSLEEQHADIVDALQGAAGAAAAAAVGSLPIVLWPQWATARPWWNYRVGDVEGFVRTDPAACTLPPNELVLGVRGDVVLRLRTTSNSEPSVAVPLDLADFLHVDTTVYT